MPELSIQQRFLNALENRDLDQAARLISTGADVNAVGGDPDHEAPLMRAISVGDVRIVQFLISAGADVNRPAALSGRTPLMIALDSATIMEALISAGADVNARAAQRHVVSPLRHQTVRCGGETALHLAAAANNAAAVRLLIQAGAKIEARAENGLAPLDYAVKIGSPTEAAVMLVEAGAELTSHRLEQMNSGVHRADSDIWEFPSNPSDQKPPEPPPNASNVKPVDQPTSGDARPIRCPKCGALLFSLRSRICGNCNAILPADLFVSDEQIQSRQEQRKWASELANAFSRTPKIQEHSIDDPKQHSPLELVRQMDCATEFKTRERPPLLLYVVPSVLLSLFMFTVGIRPNIIALLALPSFFAGYLVWRRANPICPSCKQNILTCSPTHCVICAAALNQCRCGTFSADGPSPPLVFPKRPLRRFPYCPGCGAFLDTWL